MSAPLIQYFGVLSMAVAGAAAVWWAFDRLERSLKTRSGRAYGDVNKDIYREAERRAGLLLLWVQSREQRLDRAERR